MTTKKTPTGAEFSRRTLLKQAALTSAGFGALALNRNSSFEFIRSAAAATHPAIGTYPDGSSGNSVTVSIAVPRTGAYAVQGEDELKGWQLAVEHIN